MRTLATPKQPPTMTRGAQRDKDRARADARANKSAKGTGSGGGGLAQAAKGQSDAAALAAKKEMKAKLKAEGKIKEKTGGTKAPPKSKVKNAVRLGHDEGKRMRLGLCPCVSVCCAVMCGDVRCWRGLWCARRRRGYGVRV